MPTQDDITRPPGHLPGERRDMVPVGYLSKAHGIRGELVFVLTAESPDLVSGRVFLRHKTGGPVRPFMVERTRRHHGSLLVVFAGVASRNDAEALRSHTVLVPRDRLPPLAEDEILLDDLPGLRVIAVQGGKEREIGVIAAVDAPAGQVLWSIRSLRGGEILFPAVDEFVLSIEPERGEARIAPPPGLLELYESGE